MGVPIVYSTAHVLWIAQNAGGSSVDYQEIGSSRFELEHTNISTYKLFVLVVHTCQPSRVSLDCPGFCLFVPVSRFSSDCPGNRAGSRA